MLFKSFLQNDIRRFLLSASSSSSSSSSSSYPNNADDSNGDGGADDEDDSDTWIPPFSDLSYKIQELYGFPHESAFLIKYADPEGDLVTITNDVELQEMVTTLRLDAASVAKLFILPLVEPTTSTAASTAANGADMAMMMMSTPPRSSSSSSLLTSTATATATAAAADGASPYMPQSSRAHQGHAMATPAEEPVKSAAETDGRGGDFGDYNQSYFDASWKDTEIYDVLRDISWYICARDLEYAPRVRSLGSLDSKHLIPPEKLTQAMAAQHHLPLKVVSRKTTPNGGGVNGSRGRQDSPVLSWNVDRVCQWLRQSGLGEFESKFRAHDISGDVLLELSHDALRSMDILSAGKQLRLLKAISSLQPSPASAFSVAALNAATTA